MKDQTSISLSIDRVISRRRWQRASLILGVAVLVGITNQLAQGPPNPSEGNGGLSIPTADLLLGRVAPVAEHTVLLRISNKSSRRITVDRFETSCLCTSITPQRVCLEPGGNVSVSVKMDLRARSAKEARERRRAVAVRISPRLKELSRRGDGWLLRATIENPLSIDPASISFSAADRLVAGGTHSPQSFRVASHRSLSDLKATPSLTGTDVRLTRQSASEFEVVVVPPSNLPRGPFQFSIDLLGVGKTGERLGPIAVPVNGFVCDEIEALPGTVVLAPQAAGTPLRARITLRSLLDRRFIVDTIESSGAAFDFEPLDGEDKNVALASRTYYAVSESGVAGPIRGLITFICIAEGEHQIKVAIPYNGYIVESAVSATQFADVGASQIACEDAAASSAHKIRGPHRAAKKLGRVLTKLLLPL